MKVIVTGSLGHISRPLVEELVQKHHSVTVVSRNHERKKEIEALGAVAAIGSLDDLAFLTNVFRSSDAAYCMNPPDFAAADQIAFYEQTARSYANAVLQSGLKRVVYLSSIGAELSSGTGFITGSNKAEHLLKNVPAVKLTCVRPAFFYYNLLAFIDMIKAAGFIGHVYGGEDRLALVSPTDIASVVAEELTDPSGKNKIRYVASDDRTCEEVASLLGRAIGKPDLKWLVLPRHQVLESLLSAGVPANAAANLVELGEAIHSGRLRADFDLHKPAFGKVSLEDFANEFSKAYNNN
jgi:uncharacterized protein YbjT (DUF2867 family)